MNKYTTILYDVKKELKVSIVEYIYLDTVYHLQAKNGYAFASNEFYCERLDITRRQLSRIKQDLIERGLLEVLPQTNDRKVKVTEKYLDVLVPANGGTKCPTREDKMSHAEGQNVPHTIENEKEVNNRYSKEQKYHPDVNKVIDLFVHIAPTTYTRWYKIGKYRENITALLKIHPFERVKFLLDTLAMPVVKSDEFCPQITNPAELLNKFDKTVSYLTKKSAKLKAEAEKVW